MLERAVSSIYHQVDRLFVYLNNYDNVPSFLNRPKISVFTSAQFGDIKDSGKFFGLTQVDTGIYLSIDDDIEYPADYVRVMTRYLAKFEHRCVVGVHGIVLPTLATSFFDRSVVHFEKAWDMTAPVSILGTGTTAFSIEHAKLDFSIFQHHGMADICLAIHLKQRGIPALAIRRRHSWLRDLSPNDQATLYRTTRQDATEHTELIVANRPWGFDDLLSRVERADITDLLPGRWRALVAAYKEHPDAADVLTEYPLEMIYDAARTLMSPCDAWKVARVFRPTRKRDARFHARLLTSSLAYYPEEVLGVAKRLYERCVQNGENEAAGEYAGVYIAALGKLSMHDQADSLYSELENQGVKPGSAIIHYLRLKAEQGAHEKVLAIAEDWYDELKEAREFLPLVLSAVAHVEGPDAALHSLMPIFHTDGLQASRQRRSAACLLAQAGIAPLNGRKSFALAAAEKRALRGRKARVIFDLVTLYSVLGERALARKLIDEGRTVLERDYGAATLCLLSALTASDPMETLCLINQYNSSVGLAQLKTADEPGSNAGFLGSLMGTDVKRAEATPHKVSVIMSAFNAENTVDYAVRSILRQSYTNLELIIVDDASTDDTWNRLQELQASDDRVVIIRNDSNAGPYVCRNVAITAATGAFIAIQDADDFAHPQRLERQMRAFEASNVVAVYARHVRVDRAARVTLENNGEILGDGPVTLICRRSVFHEIGRFEAVRTRGDIEFRDRLKRYYGEHRLAQLPEVLVYALHDPRSNSHAMSASPEAKRRLALFRAQYNRRLISARRPEDVRLDAGGVAAEDESVLVDGPIAAPR